MYGNVKFLLFFIFSHVKISQSKSVHFEKPYCDVSAGISPQRFNFTALSRKNDRIIKDNKTEDSIRLQLCEPLHEPCTDMEGYRVCLKRDGQEIGIGMQPPSVSTDSGIFEFKFTREYCTDVVPYTVLVTLKCDNEDNYDSLPQLLKPHDSDACNYHLVWETKAACGTEHMQKCKAVDSAGKQYDLSSLILRSENYVIPVSDKSWLILNVCHSIVFEHNIMCPGSAGSCYREIDKDQNFVFRNLGDVGDPPYFDEESKELTLKYDSGEMCLKGGANLHTSSVITFICDRAATNTLPEYKGENSCIHSIIWRTIAACSVDSADKNQRINAKNDKLGHADVRTCKVINPVTNIEYNLRELMNRDFRTLTSNATEYTFQVCGSVSDGSCPPGTGACIVKNNTSAGMANSNLMWSPGGPYVNYTNGAACGDDDHYSTMVAFFCGAEESTNAPIIIKNDMCSLIIHWNTPLVCKEQIKCETKNGEIRLSSLTRTGENYIVKANNTKFHINVCRPLIPKPDVICSHGSAVCQEMQKVNGPTSNKTDFQNLGYPLEKPFFDDQKNVILRYAGDSPCPENNRLKTSSNLTFSCDYKSGMGMPRYKNYENCTYVFEWMTRLVCDTVEGRWTMGCTIVNPNLSHNVNLTSLSEKVYNVKSSFGEKYNISICGGDTFCEGSTICKGDARYGNSSTVIFDYNRNVIRLKFSNGTRCKTGSYSSAVNFVCDESVGNGQPALVSEDPCSVEFEWKTSVVCVNYTLREMTLNEEPKVARSMEVVREAGYVGPVIVTVLVIVVIVVGLLIYLWSSERRARLRYCCSSMSSSRENCRARYTKVNATEEARLLLDAADSTQCLTDSDSDDELLDA